MNFATTQGDKNLTALAARIFGVGRRTKVAQRAAKALREANPALEEIRSLPKGTPILVPEIEGAEPSVRVRPLPEFASRGVLRAARADAEVVGELFGAIVDAVRTSADARLERLRSAAVKKAAGQDPAMAARVERAIARAEGEKAAATELQRAQKKAVATLQEDIARLLS